MNEDATTTYDRRATLRPLAAGCTRPRSVRDKPAIVAGESRKTALFCCKQKDLPARASRGLISGQLIAAILAICCATKKSNEGEVGRPSQIGPTHMQAEMKMDKSEIQLDLDRFE